MDIRVKFTDKFLVAENYMWDGYTPVGCYFGPPGSVVDKLQLDTHGNEHLGGVASRAYEAYVGEPRRRLGFIVNGEITPLKCFAVAALAGGLPHPSRDIEFTGATPLFQEVMTRDLTTLALLIDRHDADPSSVRLGDSSEGHLLHHWKLLNVDYKDPVCVIAGANCWRMLTTAPPADLLEAAQLDAKRIDALRQT